MNPNTLTITTTITGLELIEDEYVVIVSGEATIKDIPHNVVLPVPVNHASKFPIGQKVNITFNW